MSVVQASEWWWYEEGASGARNGVACGACALSVVVDGHLRLVVGEVELEANRTVLSVDDVGDGNDGTNCIVGVLEGEDDGDVVNVRDVTVGCWRGHSCLVVRWRWLVRYSAGVLVVQLQG